MASIINKLLIGLGVAFLIILVLLFRFSHRCDQRVLAASTSPNQLNYAKYEIRQCDGDNMVTTYIGVGPVAGQEDRRFTYRAVGAYKGSINDSTTGWPTFTLGWKNDDSLVIEAPAGNHLEFFGDELNGVSVRVVTP